MILTYHITLIKFRFWKWSLRAAQHDSFSAKQVDENETVRDKIHAIHILLSRFTCHK